MTVEIMHYMLVNYGVATDEEIRLVACINGYNEETMTDILYVRTGYRDFSSFLEG